MTTALCEYMFHKDTKSKMPSNNPSIQLFCQPSCPNCICLGKIKYIWVKQGRKCAISVCHLWSGFYFCILTQQRCSRLTRVENNANAVCLLPFPRASMLLKLFEKYRLLTTLAAFKVNNFSTKPDWHSMELRSCFGNAHLLSSYYSWSTVTPFLNGNNTDLQKSLLLEALTWGWLPQKGFREFLDWNKRRFPWAHCQENSIRRKTFLGQIKQQKLCRKSGWMV